jgi:hypothetical protein
MKRFEIHDAEIGDCRPNRSATDLRLLAEPKIGAAGAPFIVPDSFFEPLPDEILRAFSGNRGASGRLSLQR